jgi:hypothetical protein
MALRDVWGHLERLSRLSFAWKCSSRASSADPTSVPCAFPLSFLLLVSYVLWLRSAAGRLSLAGRGWCTARRRIAFESLVRKLEGCAAEQSTSWSIHRAVNEDLRMLGRSMKRRNRDEQTAPFYVVFGVFGRQVSGEQE